MSEPSILMGGRSREKMPEPLTFLKCLNCGVENSRPFRENDYVLKIVEDEKCPKCGGTRSRIINIYVPEKKESK